MAKLAQHVQALVTHVQVEVCVKLARQDITCKAISVFLPLLALTRIQQMVQITYQEKIQQ